MAMTTNEIKKGMKFRLANGWMATMLDNKKGNIRFAEVQGLYTEAGSVYAHDIISCKPDAKEDVWHTIILTDKQKQHASMVENLFG
tara:strand:- start:1463 stop:1720 length:258 start_codon:yes stop_codon:yes gene_type:complete